MTRSELADLRKCLTDALLESMRPVFRQVQGNSDRLDRLEQVVDPSDMAALINTVQALQVRVRELEFEMAKVEHRSEGIMEPSPWK